MRLNRFRRTTKAHTPASDDLGFGSQLNTPHRLITAQGNFNVTRRGHFGWTPYQQLVEMGWGYFWLLVLGGYIGLNALFAVGFLLIGPEQIGGFVSHSPAMNFANAFFFSVQTFTSVGYGALSPAGTAANLLASLDALVGLIAVAMVTGLFFARFARPRAQILFSQAALFAPYRDTELRSLQFRIANGRPNKIINLQAQAVISWFENLENGELQRRFSPLALEREQVAFFPLNWTVVHIINEDSPLYDWTADQVQQSHLELIVLIEGYDETYAQSVFVNKSYAANEMVWNARFEMMYRPAADTTVLELDRISAYEELPSSATP